MKDLTEEMLTEAEAWAELPISWEELAFAIDIPLDELQVRMSDENDKLGAAIKRGSLKSRAELYKSILKHAKQGSTPAQNMAMELFNRQNR